MESVSGASRTAELLEKILIELRTIREMMESKVGWRPPTQEYSFSKMVAVRDAVIEHPVIEERMGCKDSMRRSCISTVVKPGTCSYCHAIAAAFPRHNNDCYYYTDGYLRGTAPWRKHANMKLPMVMLNYSRLRSIDCRTRNWHSVELECLSGW